MPWTLQLFRFCYFSTPCYFVGITVLVHLRLENDNRWLNLIIVDLIIGLKLASGFNNWLFLLSKK